MAANYVRGTQVAQSFEKQTGVRTFQWDVADGEDCRAGVARVKDELGAVDILATNAGITLDRAFHKMSDSEWFAVACRARASRRASALRRPSVMKRACHLHTPGVDLPERRTTSWGQCMASCTSRSDHDIIDLVRRKSAVQHRRLQSSVRHCTDVRSKAKSRIDVPFPMRIGTTAI